MSGIHRPEPKQAKADIVGMTRTAIGIDLPSRISTPPPKQMNTIEEYVARCGGKYNIKRILIANNGIAAVKCIRSIRQWAYQTFGNEKIVEFVVMATPEDLRANAEYIRMADAFEEVPGGSNNNNYANVSLIVDVAERVGAQAVWAGWGHASENPKLPAALANTSIIFIGPPARPMHDLGDKIGATLIAQSADVSVVPWSGSGLKIDYEKEGIPDAMFKKATIHTLEEAEAALAKVGFPAMIKASEGGGGKGIRKVEKQEDLESAFRQVQGEVPGSPIFMMKMARNCHHLEVQVLGDMYGEAISLYSRDCSVQRRHQKIIEEGPVIAAPREILDQMEAGAVRLAKAVGYVGAGTVEYLYNDAEGYFFLELNPRLQVEHPVTEQISNVNLPAAQLNVAMGIPLDRIPEIRRLYDRDHYGEGKIDFAATKQKPPRGHVIATRITAENPEAGFKPTSGQIKELTFRSTPHVWGYFSVGAQGGLHEFADSQFGHLFAWGNEREEARKAMVLALKELSIRGDIRTPVDFLFTLLERKQFIECTFHTSWLDELIQSKALVVSNKVETTMYVICGAVYKGYRAIQQRSQQFLEFLDRGQIPPSELLQNVDSFELIYLDTKYEVKVVQSGTFSFVVYLNDSSVDVECREMADSGLLMVVDGKSHMVFGMETPTGLRLTLGSKTVSFSREFDPSKLMATSAGKLVRYLVEDNAALAAGQAYAEMEVMKMYMPLTAPEAGRISFIKSEGSMLASGDVIARMVLDDPSQVKTASLYRGKFPKMEPPHPEHNKPHLQLQDYLDTIRSVMAGYCREEVSRIVSEMTALMQRPDLPVYKVHDRLSAISQRIPAQLVEQIVDIVDQYKIALEKMGNAASFPSKVLQDLLDKHEQTLSSSDARTFNDLVEDLREVCLMYAKPRSRLVYAYTEILERFVEVEKLFELRGRDEVILELRQKYKDDLEKVLDIFRSRSENSQKKDVVLLVLEQIGELNMVDTFVSILHDLAVLNNKEYLELSVRARQMLMQYQLPSFKQREVSMEGQLRKAVRTTSENDRVRALEPLVVQQSSLFDVLCQFIMRRATANEAKAVRRAALEVYIRRSYRTYEIKSISVSDDHSHGILVGEFQFVALDMQEKAERHDFMRASESADELTSHASDVTRSGLIAVFADFQQLKEQFLSVLERFQPSDIMLEDEGINVMNLFVKSGSLESSVAETTKEMTTLLQRFRAELRAAGIRRLTLAVCTDGHFPKYYTYRERLDYGEDMILRHMEPALAFYLELQRLSNYDITYVRTLNRQIHMYFGKEQGKTDSDPTRAKVLFVRTTVRQGDAFMHDQARSIDYLIAQAERVILEGIKSLEVAIRDPRYKDSKNNHLFVKILSEVQYEPQSVDKLIRALGNKYGQRLWKLNVGELELAGKVKIGGMANNLRFVIRNPTGYAFEVDGYLEIKNATSKNMILEPIQLGDLGSGQLGGLPVDHPYAVTSTLERKRYAARDTKTTYVYDFPILFKEALKDRWESYQREAVAAGLPKPTMPPKNNLIEATELALGKDGSLRPVERPPGRNDIGMVAWKMTLRTPEVPSGRDLIVISNDITYMIGSFGPREDDLFKAASEMARVEGLPRIYISANSGARIGLAQEVRDKFKVEWEDPANPQKGFKYLYVTDEDYKDLHDSIKAEQMENGNWRITDIIGIQEGLGVENLRGSGMIAGETSAAYDEIFTVTLVTGRSVGIGAYLVRLGQRVIQNDAPIILTGAAAINRLLGKSVYASNVQLGGPQIMFNNGVSHIDVNSDLRGVSSILRWLSFVPVSIGKPLPVLNIGDPVDRPIEFMPTSTAYDPRHMLAGTTSDNGNWVSGFFDRGSWMETLSAWAMTVICGRARLGGIPMGVISVETRCVEHVIPADPANPESTEVIVQKAGQVWFPDSAYKTASAIQDFNHGEQLPLIIFANWRGFSGGMRDMFDEILKFGSYIVDALRTYQQPVFVYIPPYGELRGGAWVVLDPTINPDMMEMFCDSLGTGGVLEATGTVEIKYRQRDILKTIRRLDAQVREMNEKLSKESEPQKKEQIKAEIAAREAALLPAYQQVAVSFAELHDTPGRMKEKGVISDVVDWKNARSFFYNRLKRRLVEHDIIRRIRAVCPSKSFAEAKAMVVEWEGANKTDAEVIAWAEQTDGLVDEKLQELKKQKRMEEIRRMCEEDLDLVKEVMKGL